MGEASRKQHDTTGLLHPLSCARPRARLTVKNSGVPLQFCILNHTVLVFAKNASHMHY